MTYAIGDRVWLREHQTHGRVYALPSILRRTYIVRRNDGVLCSATANAMAPAHPVRVEDAPAHFWRGGGVNVAEKLAREIARVTALREQYATLDGMPQINVKPALLMLDWALEDAKRATGIDDAGQQIAALSSLQGFEE